MAPGTDMLARMAVARSPDFSTVIWPLTTSVAMARKGIGSLSKFQSPLASASSRSTASSATPVIAPLGSSSEPSR